MIKAWSPKCAIENQENLLQVGPIRKSLGYREFSSKRTVIPQTPPPLLVQNIIPGLFMSVLVCSCTHWFVHVYATAMT